MNTTGGGMGGCSTRALDARRSNKRGSETNPIEAIANRRKTFAVARHRVSHRVRRDRRLRNEPIEVVKALLAARRGATDASA